MVCIRLCNVIFGCILFLKCIRIDLGIFSGIILVVVVNVIRLEFVGKEIFNGKWVCELLLVLIVFGSSMWFNYEWIILLFGCSEILLWFMMKLGNVWWVCILIGFG